MPYETKYYTRIIIELGEAFRGTGTLFFFPEGRTYSPPAKQAVVSLPLVGHGALPRAMQPPHKSFVIHLTVIPIFYVS